MAVQRKGNCWRAAVLEGGRIYCMATERSYSAGRAEITRHFVGEGLGGGRDWINSSSLLAPYHLSLSLTHGNRDGGGHLDQVAKTGRSYKSSCRGSQSGEHRRAGSCPLAPLARPVPRGWFLLSGTRGFCLGGGGRSPDLATHAHIPQSLQQCKLNSTSHPRQRQRALTRKEGPCGSPSHGPDHSAL